MLVESSHGTSRVTEEEIQGRTVHVLTKYFYQDDTPCELQYSLLCDTEHHLTLQRHTLCNGDVQRTASRRFYTSYRSRATAIHEAHFETHIRFAPALGLPDVTEGRVAFRPTRETCVSEDSCLPGCCANGLQCEKKNGQNECVAKAFSQEHICADGHSDQCWPLIAKVNAAITEWVFIATSSDGGGHISAANNLKEVYGAALRERVRSVSKELEAHKALIAPEKHRQLGEAVRHVLAADPAVGVIDLMESPCANLLGSVGLSAARLTSNTWNDRLNKLCSNQWLVQPRFDRQCTSYMRRVLEGKVFPFHGPPSTTISSQPLLLQSLAEAIREIGEEMVDDSQMFIQLYMTDLPTPEGDHFFCPVRASAENSPKLCERLIVHSVVPVDTDGVSPEAYVAQRCGLPVANVRLESFMPIAQDFTHATGLPRPGTPVSITLKAQLPREEDFFGGERMVLDIAATDIVVLIMLGSQPTFDAMLEYAQQAKLVDRIADRGDGLWWIFMGCGNPIGSDHKQLFQELADIAEEFNQKQRALGDNVRFIPFTAQSAEMIMGRSDVTITRSGGMTCGELLALASRGDKRRVYIHVEVVSEPRDTESREDQTDNVLDGGLVPWEAGNARFVMKALGARLITPTTLLSRLESTRFVV